jgi:hypothetical protein
VAPLRLVIALSAPNCRFQSYHTFMGPQTRSSSTKCSPGASNLHSTAGLRNENGFRIQRGRQRFL